jgi:hypothetical protein
MFDREYFNYIQEQILIEKFFSPRTQEHPPPVVMVRQEPPEPDIKIPIPIKIINEEFHIKKLKKKMIQKNKKKIKENKKRINLFLKQKSFIPNYQNNSGSCIINNNGNKNDFLNDLNKYEQKSKIFIIQKKGDGNKIISKNNKNNNSNKSFDFTQSNYKLKKISIDKIVPRAFSVKNIRVNINNLINIL